MLSRHGGLKEPRVPRGVIQKVKDIKMWKFVELMDRLNRDENGATIVEYGVALTIVTAIAVATLTAIGTDVAGQFTAADNLMN